MGGVWGLIRGVFWCFAVFVSGVGGFAVLEVFVRKNRR